jgi:hypothetical protein
MSDVIRLHCEHKGRPLVETLEIEKEGKRYLVRVCAPCVKLLETGTIFCKEARV